MIAVAAGVILVLLVELLLTVAGVAPLADRDPFVGFKGSTPVFVPDRSQSGRYTLNPAKGVFFNQQGFVYPKPPDTFRIVSFGGSTTYGRPYLNDTSFPNWLSRTLNWGHDDWFFENINLGGISYASYRVSRLADEMFAYSPDLYILYSGHNEFLESRTFEKIIHELPALKSLRSFLHRSRLYTVVNDAVTSVKRSTRTTLPDQVDAKLEEIGGYELYHRDEVFKEGVIAQYRHSLERTITRCRERKIPLILCTLTSNLSGISPFKSEHKPGLDRWKIDRFGELLSSAEAAYSGQDYAQALEHILAAESIDDSFAQVHYLKGHILLRLGEYGKAREALIRAKEEDIVPLRALEEFNNIIREVAGKYDVPLADVESAFRMAAPNGIPGNELFLDHVHPTIRGQQLIAWVIMETAAGHEILPFDPLSGEGSKEQLQRFHLDEYNRLTPRYIAEGYWGIGRVFHWAGKFPEAREALLESWKTVRDIAEIPYLLGDIEVAIGNPEQALLYFREAQKIGGEESRIAYAMTKAALQLGDGYMAIRILDGIPADQREGPLHLGFAGEAYLLVGRTGEAVKDLEAAVTRTQEVQRFHFSLARAYILEGKEALAMKTFGRYAELAGIDPLMYSQFRALTLEKFSETRKEP